ncbi:MAG: glucosaminidase domain-containing protein, partial [Prevotella sp.]|nr:glucosaminidase domain-containing protein [Prevotella sp.]
MRRITCILLMLLLSVAAFGQSQKDKRYHDYIATYKDLAIEQMLKYNIPASITLAQGLLESSAGYSELATIGNNHFGIKCHNGWRGRTMYRDDDAKNDCFRVYKNPRESYEDHSIFLTTGQRYASLFKLKRTDYKGWARGLKAAGYA